MPKRLRLRAHLPLRELEAHYRRARNPVLRTHYPIVWHLSLDKSTREVAVATDYSQEWIREVARRYNESGPEGWGTAGTEIRAVQPERCSTLRNVRS